MGNHQTTNSSSENHSNHDHHHTRASISKTMTRGKNFMRLGRKRLSGTWDTSFSKLPNESGTCMENEFSNMFPSAVALEKSADVCSSIAGLEDHDPAPHIANNNNNNRKEDEEEEIKNENNRFVSSFTADKTSQLLSQTKLTQISTESAALLNESICSTNTSNNNNATTNNNKSSAFHCDTSNVTTDKKVYETDSIFVHTESWKTAKSYTEAIKHRKDSTLDKTKSPSRESIVIRQYNPPHSSSSESNFTDPQTLLSPDVLTTDGFITEINECYYSDSSDQEKNVEKKSSEILKKLSVTKNESVNIVSECVLDSDKTLNLSIETLHKISIVDVSPLTVEKLDPISIFSNSFESIVLYDSDENEESDVMMKSNKITPLSVSNRSPATRGATPRINTSTSGSLFNVARVKKVELSDLNRNGTTDRLSSPKSSGTSGNVLRKVASITATTNTDASKRQEITKPTFVPEKLNFGAFEKFEGQMLINWFQSTLGNTSDSDSVPSRLLLQCCTNLLVAGVIKQIPDKHAAVQEIFKPNLMYQWTHTESQKVQESLPGKLSSNIWPETDSPTPSHTMPSILFTSTPKICDKQQHPELTDAKAIINKCETMDELCNTMQLMLHESANVRNLSALNINNNNQSVSDMSEYVTGSASMLFQSALDNSELLKSENQTKIVETCDFGVQTNILCEEKEVQTVKVITDVKEVQTEVISESQVPAPAPPPPPPPMNIPKPPPAPGVIPKPPPPAPPGAVPNAPAPPPPLAPIANTTNGPPVPPPVPTGKLGATIPPPLPLPKQTDWQTTITLRKPPKNPPKPMKPLFWTRIVTKVPVTTPATTETDAPSTTPEPDVPENEKTPELWQEIDETSLDNLDEFTELFSRQVVIPKQKSRDDKDRPTKIETLKVLDSKRSQTVGIFARSLHVGFEEIEHAIYHCDTSIVSLETLQHIMAIKATPDELAQIKEVASGDLPLDAPEKFLLQISKISCFSERISCIVLQAEFDEAVSTVSRKLETIIRLCTFMMENENLKIIFSIILTLGNYMNGGNRTRGQADGFGLEILGKLKDVKSKDSKITLLHFIVKTFIQQARKNGTLITELVLPIPDPTDIDKSINVDFEDCKQQLNILQTKLNSCRKTIDIVVSTSGDSASPFKEKMDAFLEEATLRLENKMEKLDKSKKIFVQALAFYKFNPKSGTLDECTPSQFFELWTPFTHDFRDIWIKEIDTLTNDLLKKTKKAREATKYVKKPNSTSQSSGKQPSKLKQRMSQLRNRDN